MLARGLSEDMQSIPRATFSDPMTASSMRGKFDFPSIDMLDLTESLLSMERVDPLRLHLTNNLYAIVTVKTLLYENNRNSTGENECQSPKSSKNCV